MRILVIEDESKVARALKEGLHREHYEVAIAPNGEEGFFLLNSGKFDLVILDLNLPGRDGIEILKTLRQRQITVPVLILTARDTIDDRVLGLESGADDYLSKPFAFAELLARIHVLLRRGQHEQDTALFLVDLHVDVSLRRVLRGDQPVTLTVKEFDLLVYLLRHKSSVVSREMLSRDVWQMPMGTTPLDNVIDVHIAHLRRKVDEPFQNKLLHTVRGVGFILSEETP